MSSLGADLILDGRVDETEKFVLTLIQSKERGTKRREDKRWTRRKRIHNAVREALRDTTILRRVLRLVWDGRWLHVRLLGAFKPQDTSITKHN